MPQIAADGGARLYYETEGSGPLVVLVHGGTGTGSYDWEFQRGPWSQHFRLATPDLRGHGRSDDPTRLLSIAQIGRDLRSLIDALGDQPAAIVGFSIGATAVLSELTRDPGLTRCFVGIGPSRVGSPERVPGIIGGSWPPELIALHHEHGHDPEHWRTLREQLARSWAYDLDLSDAELHAVQIPTLIVCGDRDRIEPVESALALSRELPSGELLVLPGAGHFVSRQRPAELTATVALFLERKLGRGG